MARLDRLPMIPRVAQLGRGAGAGFAYEMLRALAGLEESLLQDRLAQLVDTFRAGSNTGSFRARPIYLLSMPWCRTRRMLPCSESTRSSITSRWPRELGKGPLPRQRSRPEPPELRRATTTPREGVGATHRPLATGSRPRQRRHTALGHEKREPLGKVARCH